MPNENVASGASAAVFLLESNRALAALKGIGFVNSDPKSGSFSGLVENGTARGVFFTKLEVSS